MLLGNILASDPLLQTYTNPSNNSYHPQQLNLFAFIYLLPSLLLAALLYPPLSHLRSLRWLRLFFLMPLSVYCCLRLPIDYSFLPTCRRAFLNMSLASAALTIAIRSVHWGLINDYKDGKILIRPEFIRPPSSTKPLSRNKSIDLSDWLAWTLELSTSSRGIQYAWGVRATPTIETTIQLIKRIYKINLIHLIATSYSIICRDQGSAQAGLLKILGIPQSNFYGSKFLGEGLAIIAFGYYIVSQIEIMFGYGSLLVHLINHIHHRLLPLPEWIIRSCDPTLCVPMFNRPHAAPSLALLWGKAWHQNFRQVFLILGGTPAAKLAKFLRLNSQLQRLFGLIGCFVISALLHEYVIHFIARPPHPNPHILYHEYPGAAIYFLAQPIGIIIEPFVIPYIPGGGVMWVHIFTLITTIPFKNQFFSQSRLLDDSYPAFSWLWFFSSLLIPGFTSRG